MHKISTKNIIIFMLLMFSLTFVAAVDAKTNETPRYDVVSEFIRSLSAAYHVQQNANKEFSKTGSAENPLNKIVTVIKNSTSYKLELTNSIGIFKRMRLDKPFDTLLPTMIELYNHKYALFDEIVKISTQILKEPNSEKNFSENLARIAEINAEIEYIDKTIFNSTVLFFGLLVDKKPDNLGRMSHLIITTPQKQTLLNNINLSFGKSLDNNTSWIAKSAALLRVYLLKKGYKCRDKWQN